MTRIGLAQTPAGSVSGVVRDVAANVVSAAQVQARSRSTGLIRTTTTSETGDYSFPALSPGEYDVSAEAAGFRKVIRAVTVETGTTTRSDLVLPVGDVSESVRVQAAAPLLRYDSAAISGVITRDQIQSLPLNGRTFLELGKLEPGMQSPTGANRNRTVVPILGAPASNVGGARFTIDGGSVTSIGLGGSQLGLSQEAVHEFQVATVSFDVSTGMTDTGAINVVSRGGGNELRTSAFYFFRDHNLAAYPALKRDPSDTSPFFQRQQFGIAAGGPLRRNRAFYFGTWERNDQRAVATTTLLTPDFAHLSRTTASPVRGDLVSVRVDAKINDAHSLFVRHSYDGSRAFGPAAAITGGGPNAYPSSWNRVRARANQSLLALTSVLRGAIVNDLRVSSFVARTGTNGAGDHDCAGCLGLGRPSISIFQSGLVIGNSTAIDNDGSRFHLGESIAWQLSTHRVRLGVSWEQNRERNFVWANEPVTITLFSPDRVRAYNSQPDRPPAQRIPLPTVFRTIDDLLRLPVHSFSVGVGDPGVIQAGGGRTRIWNTVWMYADDAWRLHERLTLTYGLGWGIDTALNHDLSKPILLAPVLGPGGLGPTENNWTNFSPVVGVVWSPKATGKTVVRAGAGHYYRPHGLTSSLDAERVALSPHGSARQNFPGSSIFNALPGVPGLPIGAPMDFRNSPTLFTGADLLTLLPALRGRLAERLANADPSWRRIEITKQAPAAIFPERVPNPSAIHANFGIQQELGQGLVLAADVAYRHFVHVPQNGGSIDANHFNDNLRGAALRECTVAEADDANALCSLGPINVQKSPYRFSYRGLMLRVEKRLSKSRQFLASYAYASNTGTNTGNGFNLRDWLENRGPAATDLRHLLNVSGTLLLPLDFNFGFNFSYSSAPPFSAYLSGIDFNGDGTAGDLLPGTTVNAFNRGLGREDLERLVAEFNDVYAGTRDGQDVRIPQVRLPEDYSFGDNSHALDVRLSKTVAMPSGIELSLISEVFNVYNASNLTGYTGDLESPAFGQPTSRATQTFGSVGPRSFQLAIRLSF